MSLGKVFRAFGFANPGDREVWVERTILFRKTFKDNFIFQPLLQFQELTARVFNSNPQHLGTTWPRKYSSLSDSYLNG